jgi:hypothetical protein
VPADHGVGFVDVLEDSLAALVIKAAALRQADAARVAIKQPGAEMRFQPRDMLVTVDCETTRSSAALEKLPSSTTRVKMRNPVSWSMSGVAGLWSHCIANGRAGYA